MITGISGSLGADFDAQMRIVRIWAGRGPRLLGRGALARFRINSLAQNSFALFVSRGTSLQPTPFCLRIKSLKNFLQIF